MLMFDEELAEITRCFYFGIGFDSTDSAILSCLGPNISKSYAQPILSSSLYARVLRRNSLPLEDKDDRLRTCEIEIPLIPLSSSA